jgi:hypothetical protein
MDPRPRRRAVGLARRTGAAALATAVLLAGAIPALATHTHGTLDCGSAGTWQVEPASEVDPLPFEAPGPNAGVFLIEDGTLLFKAYSIEAPHFAWARAGAARGLTLVSCTLTSTGPMFSSPWLLEGVFLP